MRGHVFGTGCVVWCAFQAGQGITQAASAQVDTSRVAFQASSDSGTQIYVIHADGTGLARLTNPPGNAMAPAFSPAGQLLAFISDRGGRSAIYTMAKDGANVHPVAEPAGRPITVSWAPDGRFLAYDVEIQREDYVEIVSLDGGPAQRLATGLAPSWAPDGERIAFWAGELPQIMVIDRDGQNLRPLIKNDVPSADLNPLWSPDGTAIAFVSITAGPLGRQRATSYVQRLQDDKTTELPNRSMPCAWSPDGKRLAVIVVERGKWAIGVVNNDGKGLRKLVERDAKGMQQLVERGGGSGVACSWAP